MNRVHRAEFLAGVSQKLSERQFCFLCATSSTQAYGIMSSAVVSVAQELFQSQKSQSRLDMRRKHLELLAQRRSINLQGISLLTSSRQTSAHVLRQWLIVARLLRLARQMHAHRKQAKLQRQHLLSEEGVVGSMATA